ncbi:MAG: tRNA lysidine(34) synthetase TilS [Geobacter sp.]|nr:MAG: tRNA lysidine(34) synthetase TilS [Geobacter sp.]
MTRTSLELSKRIARTIREQRLFEPEDTLIVAISGGADSTALLDLLATLPGFAPRLVAAHVNHCLRGEDSNADEQFARELATRHDLPFESMRIDVKELAAQRGLNLEDAGRRARIAFFEELREKWRATAVALAHHADDQAETVLMRLMRGSGPSGLSGMQYRNDRGFIRPMLDITRAEIENYLKERGLTWREDASNSDGDFLRNRIRHELLPLLEGYNPAIRQRLGITAALLADEDVLLDQLAEKAVMRACSANDQGLACDISLLAAEPAALRRRVFRLALERLAGNLDHFTSRHIKSLELLSDSSRPNATLNLPQGITAIREYGTLLLKRASASSPCANSSNKPLHPSPPLQGAAGADPEMRIITGPGVYEIPNGGRLTISTVQAALADLSHLPADTAVFDLDQAPFPWHVRTFQPGDRIVPFGMSDSKKVKEIFIEAKIPLARRRQIPLVFSNDTLIWVCGLRTSHLSRVSSLSSNLVSAVFSQSG